MDNSILLEDDGFQIMRQQIELTTSNLTKKREMLASQINLYKYLQDNMSTSPNEKVMVSLGESYFVEMYNEEAKKFLSRRLVNLEKAFKEFDSKIKQAHKTIDQLIKLENLGKDEEKETFNEEGMPFLDIQEEIDEEGNILSAKINNKEFLTEIDSSKAKNLTGDIHSTISNLPQEIGNELDNSHVLRDNNDVKNEATIKENEADVQRENNINLETTEDEFKQERDQLQEMFEDMEIIEKEQNNGGNSIDQDVLLNKIDELKISKEDKFRLKNFCIQQFNDLEATFDTNSNTKEENDLVENSDLSNMANGIKSEDILELQILADDFNDTGDEDNKFADDEDWDFDFDDDSDEEQYADQLLYGGHTPFISQDNDNAANNLLWKQIMDNRQKRDNKGNHIYNTQETFTDNEVSNKKSILKGYSNGNSETKIQKKSVSFSKELKINEIENVSQELKNIVHTNQNFSRFKQQKLLNDQHKSSNQGALSDKIAESSSNIYGNGSVDESISTLSSIPDDSGSTNENPVSEFIVERDHNEASALSDLIVEKDITDNQTDKITSEKDVKFKASEDNLVKKNEIINENYTNSAVSAKVSQFKKMKAQNPVISSKPSIILQEQKAKRIDINDPSIIPFEKDKVIDRKSLLNESISEIENKSSSGEVPKKMSRFKASRINSNASLVSNEYRNDTNITSNHDVDEDKTSAVLLTNNMNEIANINVERTGNMSPEPGLNVKAAGSLEKISGYDTRPEKSPNRTSEIHNESLIQEVGEASLDYSSLQDDLNTMAKAYMIGAYDDDIYTEGPVVDKMEDFEILNQMLNSMPSKPNPIPTNDPRIHKLNNEVFDPALDEIIPSDGFDDPDEPILVDEIVENDFDYADVETPYSSENLDLEDNFLNQEIITNYQKLRQKLIFQNNDNGFKKSPEELEFEPLDEEGNPVKISRFKATRPKFK